MNSDRDDALPLIELSESTLYEEETESCYTIQLHIYSCSFFEVTFFFTVYCTIRIVQILEEIGVRFFI